MKLLLISAATCGLVLAASAWAQGEQHPHGASPAGHSAGPSIGSPSTPAGSRTAPSVHSSALSHSATVHHRTTPTHHAVHHYIHHYVRHVVHRVTHRTVVVHHRVVTRRHVVTAVHRTPVDIAKYRRTFVATRHFRISPYRAPPGYIYRRWGIGERLPGPFFARSYWLLDFGIYGLIEPPYGYVWVRYGPDAILVDEYTGEVIEVEYGVFL